MDIIIGREKSAQPGQKAGRLKLTVNGKSACVGAFDSVNRYVSGEHCTLTINDDSSMLLKNLNMQNVTYVNGQQVNSKRVTFNDTIVLGGGNYVLPWEEIKKILPKQVDVRHLKKVFDDYNQSLAEITKDQRRQNAYRAATGVLSTIAIAAGLVLGNTGGFSGSRLAFTLPLYAIIIILNAYFAYRAFKDSSAIPDRQNAIRIKFQKDCVCPGANGQSCGHYLGSAGFYDNIPLVCPRCKSQLIK